MHLGLRQKLVVLVLVILVPSLALLAFNVYRFFAQLESDQLAAHVRDAQIVGIGFDRFVHDLAQISRTTGIAVTEERAEGDSGQKYLEAVRRQVPISDVEITDAKGTVIAAGLPSAIGSDLAGEPAFRSIITGADMAVTDMRRNESGRLGFAVLTPIEESGTITGASVVTVDAKDLGQVVPASVSHGAILITDSRGALMYSNRPELADLTEQQRRDYQTPGVQVALGGSVSTTRSTTLPQLPGRWLGSVVPAGTTGWTVGLFDAAGAASSGIASEVILTGAVILAVLAVSLLAARQYGRSITDPLERLTAVTAEIERGHFDAEVPVTTHDEIGELAVNFRQMQESLKRTVGDVQLLADSARWMASTLDLDAIAHATSDYLDRVLGARAVVIALSEDGEGRLLSPRLAPKAAEELSSAGHDVAERLDIQRRGYAIVGIDPPPALAAAVPGARTLVVLPLVVNRKLIGRIDALVGPGVQRRDFERADVPLAASLAQQVAQAAENARLFEQQRTIADTLQDSLLTEPYRIPQLDIGLIYHQATIGGRIGGDFYDFIPIGEDATAIVIGDITGKGLDAARYTTIGKGALRAFALEDPEPASVLERASRVIAEQLGAENFITAVYMLLRHDTGEMSYAVAGHPPPMLLRAGSQRAELLGEGGLPLGVGPEGYRDGVTRLGTGDRVLLYTDGLSEARRGKELFGIDRTAAVFGAFDGLPVRDIASGIAEAAIAFAGGRLQDDLAVIVLERCETRRASGRTP